MNIPAYMGGVTDMWDNSKTKAPYPDYSSNGANKEYKFKQNIDDGILEFLSFDSKLAFEVLERLSGGWGTRMCQGSFSLLSLTLRCWSVSNFI